MVSVISISILKNKIQDKTLWQSPIRGGGRNKKCHCILKNNKVSTKIYKMKKKRKILNSLRKASE